MEFRVGKVTPVKEHRTIKANAVVFFGSEEDIRKNEHIQASVTVLNGSNGLFVNWKGTESYTDKDGKKAYASPIYIKSKEFDKKVKDAIIEAYVRTGTSTPRPPMDFTSDDIPF